VGTRGSKAKGDGVKTCPVSGEEIGSGGMKPAELVYKGKTIRFCCKSCFKDFWKDPEAYLKN
jgi:YHS domain-containing protein